MKFTIYKESRQGGRESNEDRTGYCYSRDSLMMVVADGMGGHLHGEVAAQIAVQFLTEAFQREAGPKLADPFLFLLKNITSAHHAILDYSEVRGLLETPRTTCVVAIVQDSVAWWAHVGDSRLYHIRNGRIQTRTKDHSRVQMLIDQGRLREEAASAHPERNKIFSCLGAMAAPQIELSRKVALQAGDTLILCTDGFWSPLTGRAICTELLKSDITGAIPRLMEMAEVRGGIGCDNLSVVAMTWADSYPRAADQVSTQTLDLDAFNTMMEEFGRPEAGTAHSDLSEEEIERAISEIRNAIRKQTGK